jgi:hypothetical protein
VSLAPYDVSDFDWLDGMDPVNVRFTEIALEGGPAHVAELEREATKILERIEDDPGNWLGDGGRSPSPTRQSWPDTSGMT